MHTSLKCTVKFGSRDWQRDGDNFSLHAHPPVDIDRVQIWEVYRNAFEGPFEVFGLGIQKIAGELVVHSDHGPFEGTLVLRA